MTDHDPSTLHHLTTGAIDRDGDTVEQVQFTLSGCPQSCACAVWHECHVDGCSPLDEDDAILNDYEQHGAVHQWIDGSWMTRDVPHNCAAFHVTEWFDLYGAIEAHGPGEYTFDIDYSGDGEWQALGFTKVASTGEES